jgi:hypothetical protein
MNPLNHYHMTKRHAIALWVCILLAPTLTLAQTEKGDWLVGGNLAFNTTRESNEFNLTPNAGYFFLRNLALGASLGITSVGKGELARTNWNTGPFIRYYIGSRTYRPFLLTGGGFESERQKGQPRESGFYFNAGLGLAAFLNETVALEFITDYFAINLKDRDVSDGFRFRVGFQVYIDRYRMPIGRG